VQTISLKTLTIIVVIFFFTSNLSGIFLPVYYTEEMQLSIAEIVEILVFTFIVVGLLPLITLKLVKKFERMISFGIFFTMLFFIVLICFKNPMFLGLVYGLSLATFWPSYNLLQFRLSKSRIRARTLSLFSSIIPSVASIISPAVGGFIISNFGFQSLFAVSIILYLIAFLFSMRIKFRPETYKFSIPKGKRFVIFFLTFILLGTSEAYWVAYPLFVHTLSKTVFQMGLVFASSATIICVVMFLVNWFSDIKRSRVEFAIIGATLNATWFFAIGSASTTYQIVALSMLSGLGSAFSISWLVHYADSFNKEHYAMILVMMEVGLMIGRIINLAPTYILISEANYAGYFTLLGFVPLFLIFFFIGSKRSK
jgi:MFS family permease